MWKKADALIMKEDQQKTLEVWVRAKKHRKELSYVHASVCLRQRVCPITRLRKD